jgi:hypothetical protein
MRLLRACDVARKQDHSRRLDARKQGSETWRHLGAVEADDQELSDIPGDRRLRQNEFLAFLSERAND